MGLGIVGKDTQYLTSIDRRITELLAFKNAGFGAFSVHGDIANEVAATPGFAPSSNGIFRSLQTSSVANNEAYVNGDLMYNRQKEPAFYCRFKLDSTSNTRLFIGLTSRSAVDCLSSSTPNGNYAGLYVNTGVNSNFQTLRGSGGSPVKVTNPWSDSVDTNYHELYMWLKKSGGHDEVSIQLDDNDMEVYTSSLPSTGSSLRYVAGIATRTSSSRTINIAKLSVNTEV